MKKIVLFILFYFVAIFELFSQLSDYKFRSISPSGGVTFKAVHQITQDKYGFMWFATTDQGIIRYDSKKMEWFRHNLEDTTSLLCNDIKRMLIDNNNRLWVATQNGLDVFVRSKRTFEHFRYKTESGDTAGKYIHYINKDRDGNIWISDETGMGKLDTVNHILNRFTITNNKSISPVNIIYFDMYGSGWAGTSTGNIYSIDFKTSSLLKFITTPGSYVTTIFADKYYFYVGYLAHGVKKFDKTGRLIKQFRYEQNSKYSIRNGKIRSITRDSEGVLWIGAYEGLFVESNGRLFRIDSENHPEIPHKSIYEIFEDNNNSLWFGTWSGGIFYMNRSDNNFIHYKHNKSEPSISNNIVSSFAELPNGKIAVGTESGGLNIFDPDNGTFKQISLEQDKKGFFNIKSLCKDIYGGLWVGTFNNQLWYRPLNKKQFIHFPQGENDGNHISAKSVYSLCPCDSGIWIGASGNDINFYNFKTKEINFLSSKHNVLNLRDRFIRSLYSDSDKKKLWVGTENGALKINNIGSKKHLSISKTDTNKLTESTIYYISKIRNNIWLGTKSGGINIIHHQTDSVSYFDANKLLVGKDVYGFVEDLEKQIWITTNEGIVLANLNLNTYRHFSEDDGIQGNIFNPQAILKDSKNRLYFGGTNGFTMVIPNKIKLNTHIPSIIFDKITINNKREIFISSDSGNKIVSNFKLRHNENSIKIDFTASNYLLPNKNKFKYRLLNFFNDWIDAGNEGTAIFTNLPNGQYVFEVKACNNDGIWNNTPAHLFITIRTPWYKTIIAYIIYFLLFSAIAFFIIYEIRNQQQLKKAVLIEKMQREQDEQLHEMKMKFFTNISHEFRTPLTLISAPIKTLLKSTTIIDGDKNLLTIVERNSARLLNLVNQIMDLRKLEKGQDKLFISTIDLIEFTRQLFSNFEEEAKRREIRFSFYHSQQQMLVEADQEKLDKIIFNLLSNAFKYTPNKGEIKINISNQTNINTTFSNQLKFGNLISNYFFEISIEDSGQGIDSDDLLQIFNRFKQGKLKSTTGSGIGLSLVKEYSLLHNGEVITQSTSGKGTKISIRLPRKQTAQRLLAETGTAENHTLAETLESKIKATSISQKNETKIMVVEDNPDLRHYLAEILQPLFDIVTAPNGKVALKLLKSIPVNLIISDVMMPEINGFELCSLIKSKIETSHIPVILLTALSSTENKVAGLQQGADAYISKPFDDELLITQINNLLEQRKQLQENYKQNLIEGKSTDIGSLDNYFLNRITARIQENINNEQFSVETLATEIGIHRSQLHRKLKQITNLSTSEYIRVIRLKNASELLKTKQYTIDEVAAMSGFNSHSYFSKSFKKYYGVNPNEYTQTS